MRVHILQHVLFEGPGYFLTWLIDNNCQISFTKFFEPGYSLPAIADLDALIILGGPMGVYDIQIYPWLSAELRLIEHCIKQGKKVLGICLGAQLVAASLGAAIRKAPIKEMGWFPVQPTNAFSQKHWLQELFNNNPAVLHWHSDQFEIPEGCNELLYSEANCNQAFEYGTNVLALQFHLEMERVGILDLIQYCWKDLSDGPYIQDVAQLVSGSAYSFKNKEILNKMLNKFLLNKPIDY